MCSMQRKPRSGATPPRGVDDAWYKEVAGKGIDGPKLAAEAKALVSKYSGK